MALRRRGNRCAAAFASRARDAAVTIDVAAPEGSFSPAARSLVLSVRWDGEPSRVTSGATALTRYTTRGTHDAGLRMDGVGTGFVVVKQPDNFAATTVLVER